MASLWLGQSYHGLEATSFRSTWVVWLRFKIMACVLLRYPVRKAPPRPVCKPTARQLNQRIKFTTTAPIDGSCLVPAGQSEFASDAFESPNLLKSMNEIQPAAPSIVMRATKVEGQFKATYPRGDKWSEIEIKNGTIIPDGTRVSLTDGSRFEVELVQRCLSVARQDQVKVTSEFPECLHLNEDCCHEGRRYEVLTPGGTIGINFER